MAETQHPPPRIERQQWGEIRLVDGTTFKDAKLYPGGARAWDWRETGTRHDPGIQPADVKDLIEHGARHVILSRGVHQRLKTQDQTVAWLEAREVEVEILQTEQAVARFNELQSEGVAVGALIHSTC